MSQAQENIVTNEESVVQENAPELEVIDAVEQEVETVAEDQQPKAFDPKTDRVEFNTPEQQAKFDYMYKQTKMSDARNAMLTDMLQTQQQQLDDLKARFSNTDAADAERILLTKIKTARDSGDDAAEFEALNELVDFKADQKLNHAKPPKQQQPNQNNDQQSKDLRYIETLMEEVDDNGNALRPWLQEDHPDFATAYSLLETKIAPKFNGDPLYLQKSMFELDQIMRNKMTEQTPQQTTKARVPNPMQGSNLTNVTKKPTIKMTREEIEIAKKLGVDPKRYAAKRDEIKGRK